MCFKNFTDIHRFYDYQFQGCMWVFEEEYYIIHDFLLPGFYIAVQFFFTLSFTLLLVSVILTLGIFAYSREDDRYMVVLLSNGASQVAGGKTISNIIENSTSLKSSIYPHKLAIFGLIAVSIFGARGDGRDWMPHWEHNDMGWAFACACVGVCILLPSGILYMAEARRERYKQLNEIGTREASAYSVGEDIRKYQQRQGHTDI